MPWNSAKDIAVSNNMEMLTITTPQENAYVLQQVVNLNLPTFVWLGCSDSQSEGNWEWLNSEQWSYSNWDSGEPNNQTGLRRLWRI